MSNINGANSFVSIDIWPIFEGNVIVRLFFRHGNPYVLCQYLISSYYVFNDIYIYIYIYIYNEV